MKSVIVKISWIMLIVLNICLAFYLIISGHAEHANNFFVISILIMIGLGAAFILE